MRGYVVCGEPRSGSSFLCRFLTTTGVLGAPTEYFNASSLRHANVTDYPEDPEGQAHAILRLGATPNGVYGLKLFSWNIERMAGFAWAERLPGLSFVSLVRLDVLGQAISTVRARQTLQWGADRPVQGEAVYDFDLINQTMVHILRARTRWSYFFARNGMPVLHLNYETVMAHPQATAEAIAAFVGVEERPVVDLAAVRDRIQRDHLSDAWRARFIAEGRDLVFY